MDQRLSSSFLRTTNTPLQSTSKMLNSQRYWKISSIWLMLLLLSSSQMIFESAFGSVISCRTSDDCDVEQCCTHTPIGRKICLNYEQQGDSCFFRFRTPTCGCAPGLKCVSTSPMQPGNWNHDYVCSRVRPFQYHKLMPYFDDEDY